MSRDKRETTAEKYTKQRNDRGKNHNQPKTTKSRGTKENTCNELNDMKQGNDRTEEQQEYDEI